MILNERSNTNIVGYNTTDMHTLEHNTTYTGCIISPVVSVTLCVTGVSFFIVSSMIWICMRCNKCKCMFKNIRMKEEAYLNTAKENLNMFDSETESLTDDLNEQKRYIKDPTSYKTSRKNDEDDYDYPFSYFKTVAGKNPQDDNHAEADKGSFIRMGDNPKSQPIYSNENQLPMSINKKRKRAKKKVKKASKSTIEKEGQKTLAEDCDDGQCYVNVVSDQTKLQSTNAENVFHTSRQSIFEHHSVNVTPFSEDTAELYANARDFTDLALNNEDQISVAPHSKASSKLHTEKHSKYKVGRNGEANINDNVCDDQRHTNSGTDDWSSSYTLYETGQVVKHLDHATVRSNGVTVVGAGQVIVVNHFNPTLKTWSKYPSY